jgi:trimeric autotransporter adhesin
MATDTELMLMSTDVYSSSAVNEAPIPIGWQYLTDGARTFYEPAGRLGFSAGAFVSSSEIVISFTGTEPGITDWLTGNVPAGLGIYSSQVAEAIKFVADVMAAPGSAGKTITFTGHSLGGGLASLIATYFNLPARVFDEAPFEASARNPILVSLYYAEYLARQTLLGRTVAAGFQSYAAATISPITFLSEFSAREAAITEKHIAGETLTRIRYENTAIHSSSDFFDVSGSTLYQRAIKELAFTGSFDFFTASVALHSMDLMTLLNASSSLRTAANALPQLLELMASSDLYGFDRTSSQLDFNRHLVRYELGGTLPSGPTITPIGLASIFGTEALRLTELSTPSTYTLLSGVIGALIDFYEAANSAPTSDFIQNVTGGIQFDASRLPTDADQRRGFTMLVNNVVALLNSGDQQRVRGALNAASLWSIQSGAVALNVAGTSADEAQLGSIVAGNSLAGAAGKDVLLGGTQVDTLNGGVDADLLIAGSGNDILIGGTGDDYLSGGQGTDEYFFASGDGHDEIRDSDGVGSVIVGATTLNGGTRIGTSVWRSADSQFLYQTVGNDLVIQHVGFEDSITVRDWTPGQLNITLSGSIAPPTGTTISGDLTPLVSGGTYSKDSLGNIIGTGPEPNRQDTLLGSTGDDFIYGLGGNDALYGGNGNDELDGGEGSNILSGGAGSDRLVGGSGVDYILGGGTLRPQIPNAVSDPLYSPPGGQQTLTGGWNWAIYAPPGYQHGDVYYFGGFIGGFLDINDTADIIEGGGGNDEIFAGYGADQIDAGADDDSVSGMGGNDVIDGGTGNDLLLGDSGRATGLANYSPVESDGQDEIRGGTGNDTIFGGGLSDRLFGGNEDDVIYGDARNLTNTPVAYHGADHIEGGAGEDFLEGEGGNDLILGGADDDIIWGDAPLSYLAGASHGNDQIHGEGGNDSVDAGGGSDVVDGGDGDDTLFGDYSAAGLPASAMGQDALIGGTGNDYLDGGGGGDELKGGSGADTILGDGSLSLVAGADHGSDVIDAGSGDDGIAGDGGEDQIQGGDGNDLIWGDNASSLLPGQFHGADYIQGGAGNDTILGAGGADTIHGDAGDDTLRGDESALALQYHGADVLDGGDGNDLLTGHGGDDRLYGGNGGDQLDGDDGEAVLNGNDVLDGGNGDDGLFGRSGDDVLLGGAGNDGLTGDDGNDQLYGGSGNDVISGDAGNDILRGGEGRDWLSDSSGNDDFDGDVEADQYFDEAGDDVYHYGKSSGRDRISDFAGADQIVLDAGIAPTDIQLWNASSDTDTTTTDLVLTLAGSGDSLRIVSHFLADGSRGIESITFANGTVWNAADILSHTVDISGPADTLSGTSGNDTYNFDNPFDNVVESAGGGTDTVVSSASFDLRQPNYSQASDLENLTLTGALSIDATGNDLNNVLTGNGANNTLDGVTGLDTLTGGAGDDTYQVNASGGTAFESGWNAGADDSVVEQTGEGYDTIITGAWSTTLAANVERLVLTHESVFSWQTSLPGSDLRRWMIGNALDNTVDTSGYTPFAYNGVVYDVVLDGGGGADILIGGKANETYIVDSLDTVVEQGVGEHLEQLSIDTVQTALEYELPANVEILKLTGSAAVAGTGNMLNNTLDGTGNSAANVLAGGVGNDRYVLGTGDSAVEQLDEGSDTVVLTAGAVRTYLVDEFANIENLELGSSALSTSNLTGNAGDNSLIGNASANVLEGGAGNDHLNGAGGANTLRGGDGDDVIESSGSGDTLDGGAGDDVLRRTGGTSQQYVFGRNYGHDTIENIAIDSALGTLAIASGVAASEIILSRDGADLILSISGDPGSMRVSSLFTDATGYTLKNYLTVSFADGTVWSDLELAWRAEAAIGNASPTTGADYLQGTPAADTIDALAGADFLFASGGDDNIQGSAGNDRLYGEDGNDTLSGGTENDVLYGGVGNDSLDGGAGFDSLFGGAGNDTYTADSDDTITEIAGEGTDLVFSASSFTLGAELENLTLTGTASTFAVGNSLPNVLTGNSGANTLDGRAGADSMVGGAGSDYYIVDNSADAITEDPAAGTDIVESSVSYVLSENIEQLTLTGTAALSGTGNTGGNTIMGNSGANTLDGGLGNDALTGGAGNDIYIVDSALDTVNENSGQGTDEIRTTLTYSLATLANVEKLTLLGSASVNGTGNTASNTITGNSGNNTLDPGSAGTDVLIGGAGDDTYIVTRSSGITITENSGEGSDTVNASVTHTLGSNLENLLLTGGGAINGTGNTANNILTGNSGNNTLTGSGGNDILDPGTAGTDSLVGGTGDDTYIINRSTGVTITESAGQGIDTVSATVTSTLGANIDLLFLGGASAINGTGNTLSNLLRGNGMNNTLNSAGGIDILEGGGGTDTLSNATSPGKTLFNGGAANDTITATANNDLLIGGTGNDALTTGQGADIIVFNLGDGQDTVAVSTTTDNTLSIGGGALYADLLFQKSGNDLLLKIGATDQITFTGYYTSASNRSVNNLQVVIEGTTDYDPGSPDTTRNEKIETFNFGGLVSAFDAARAANPSLTTWALTNALAAQYVSGSDTAALGGDLAYRYNRFGTLSDISFAPALGILGTSTFGTAAQNLQNLTALQDTSPRLS